MKNKHIFKLTIEVDRKNKKNTHEVTVEKYVITKNMERFTYGTNETNPQDTIRAVRVHLDKVSNKFIIGTKYGYKIYTTDEKKIPTHKKTLEEQIRNHK